MKYTIFSSQSVFGMANLIPKKTGLAANIWSDHKGIERQVSHRGTPRMKISVGSYMVSVTIEPNPLIIAESKHGSKSQKAAVKEAMKYISKNYDIFLKHYNDVNDEFDDEDMFNALRERGEYR